MQTIRLIIVLVVAMVTRLEATCKLGKPGLTSFSETLALFFIQFLSFRKMKVLDRQNAPSGLPEKKMACYAPGNKYKSQNGGFSHYLRISSFDILIILIQFDLSDCK